MKMKTGVPTQKVTASTLGAALTQVIIWGLENVMVVGDMPDQVEMALTTVVVFLLGYFTPPAQRDEIVRVASP